MTYMLDTDTVSYALRGVGGVAQRIRDHRPSELVISAITLGELRFGAYKRRSRRLHRIIDTFVASVAPLAFGADAANDFGRLVAELAAAGTPIGTLDVMIASHARVEGAILVTNNTKHFSRVRNLHLENWL